jgi:hypothetical protein
MDTIYYYLFAGAALVFLVLGIFLHKTSKKEILEEEKQIQQVAQQPQRLNKSSNPEMIRLQLQAYERLAILCERIGLNNLLKRFYSTDLSAKLLQSTMIQTVETEFEYNVSQQLYVSTAAWDGVKRLKEQNIFIINQLAAMLPHNASAKELAEKITEFLASDENASLQHIVSTLINNEAKMLMA